MRGLESTLRIGNRTGLERDEGELAVLSPGATEVREISGSLGTLRRVATSSGYRYGCCPVSSTGCCLTLATPLAQAGLSTTIAMPWPTPMHIVASP